MKYVALIVAQLLFVLVLIGIWGTLAYIYLNETDGGNRGGIMIIGGMGGIVLSGGIGVALLGEKN